MSHPTLDACIAAVGQTYPLHPELGPRLLLQSAKSISETRELAMRKIHFWTLVGAVLLSTALVPSLTVRAAEPDFPPKTCPFPDSPHYRPSIGATVQDNTLILVDTNTNAT